MDKEEITEEEIPESELKPEPLKSRKVPVKTSRKAKYKLYTKVPTAETRKKLTDRQKKLEKLWGNATVIPKGLNEEFSLKFMPEIYLGRKGMVIGAFALIGDDKRRAYLVLEESWLEKNTVDFEKTYTCYRPKKSTSYYGNIPVYTVGIVEKDQERKSSETASEKIEEKAAEEKLTVSTEPIVPKEEISFEPTIKISSLKIEIVFEKEETAQMVTPLLTRPIEEQDTADTEEKKSYKLEIAKELKKADWIQAGNVLVYLFKKMLEEDQRPNYQETLISLLNEMKEEVQRLKKEKEEAEEKKKNVSKMEVAKATIKKRKYTRRQDKKIIIIPEAKSEEEKPEAGTDLLLEIIKPQIEEKEISPETDATPEVKKKRGRPRKLK